MSLDLNQRLQMTVTMQVTPAQALALQAMHQALYRNRAGRMLICSPGEAPRGYQRIILAADPRHFRIDNWENPQ